MKEKIKALKNKLADMTIDYIENHLGNTNYIQAKAKEDIELLIKIIEGLTK